MKAAPSAGHSPAGPAGRPLSESARGPHPAPCAGTALQLYTVRRDLDGHVGLAVMGGRSPPVLAVPLRVVSGTCRLGRGSAAPSCGARVAPGPRGPVGTRGDCSSAVAGAGRDVTVHPPSRLRTCGVELLAGGPWPGRDVTDHLVPDGG